MAEQAGSNGAAAPKKERIATKVKMTDGREVEFVGSQKLKKDTVLDESKIQLDEASGMLVVQAGAVSVRMDFLHGETRLIPIPLSLFCYFTGHGGEQKLGDNLAAKKGEQLSLEDMVVATDDLAEAFANGKWSQRREGEGGFAGASIVIKAWMEVSGRSQEEVKNFLNGKLEAAKAKGETLSRAQLYASFKSPTTKIGQVIRRLEEEQLAKGAKVDADAMVEEFMAA